MNIIIIITVGLILETFKLQNLSALPAVSCAYQATQSYLLSSRQYWIYYLLPTLFNCCHSLQFFSGAIRHTAIRCWSIVTDINCCRKSM